MKKRGQLIVALDFDSVKEAKKLVAKLGNLVKIYKVGSQLFTLGGPALAQYLLKKKKQVFLDLKFHDIPNTVANAIGAAISLKQNKTGIFMCTIHTVGGGEMMAAAAKAALEKSKESGIKKPLIVGVTVLTSDAKKDSIAETVLERASLAKASGLDGVVASSLETKLIREKFGEDFIIVTPGIRPTGADVQDQKRVTTPHEAIQNGSDYIVVGRPIVKAENPKKVVIDILKEIN